MSNPPPVITVLLPVLNAMPYLQQALASLDAQTYRGFEVLLWDNGSSDGSVEEARRWIPGRLPGKIVTDQPLPLHECLAAMVHEAATEFCARMDGDDICLPERLAAQVAFMQQNPDVALVGCQMEFIDGAGDPLPETHSLPCSYAEILFSFLFTNPIAHPTTLFRRAMVLDVGNYARPMPVEDYDLWMRLAARHPVANLPMHGLRYRRHAGAICAEDSQQDLQLYAAMGDAAASHCQELFNLNPSTYHRLRDKQHPCACVPLFSAAAAIARRTHTRAIKLLRRPAVIRTGRCLTSQQDLLTRTLWRALTR